MFHCLAWAAPQLQYSPTACGTSQIKVNPTDIRQEMGHPVYPLTLGVPERKPYYGNEKVGRGSLSREIRSGKAEEKIRSQVRNRLVLGLGFTP